MAAMLVTVVVNCVLDAWFIFGLGWGILGAAIATIAAQVVGLAIELHHFFDKKNFVHFDRHYAKLDFGIVREIIAIGLSPFCLNVCSCMIITLINNGLMRYGGDLYVGAYGIINRFAFLIQMSVAGFNQGMQPIAGYNLGARQFDRVTRVLKYTICCATIVTTLGFIGGVFFPDLIATLFTSEPELIAIAHHGMQICFLLFPIVGFQMVTTSFFQAVRQAKKAIFLSTTRQMLLLIPLLLILPNYFGTDGVWLSMPISDAISSILAGILLFLQFRSFARKHREELGIDNR
jgi:Na+-driven multidrug efflux pump